MEYDECTHPQRLHKTYSVLERSKVISITNVCFYSFPICDLLLQLHCQQLEQIQEPQDALEPPCLHNPHHRGIYAHLCTLPLITTALDITPVLA